MAKIKFLRRDSSRSAKLGKGVKRRQIWKRPKGRDNKMREKRKGYPAVVSVGYRKEKEKRNLLKEKKPVLVKNLKDLDNVKKGQIVILGKVGKKKKLELVKKIEEKKIETYNINAKKYLKKTKKPVKKEEVKEKKK